MKGKRFVIHYTGWGSGWQWTLYGGNNKILAHNNGFNTCAGARKAARRLQYICGTIRLIPIIVKP